MPFKKGQLPLENDSPLVSPTCQPNASSLDHHLSFPRSPTSPDCWLQSYLVLHVLLPHLTTSFPCPAFPREEASTARTCPTILSLIPPFPREQTLEKNIFLVFPRPRRPLAFRILRVAPHHQHEAAGASPAFRSSPRDEVHLVPRTAAPSPPPRVASALVPHRRVNRPLVAPCLAPQGAPARGGRPSPT